MIRWLSRTAIGHIVFFEIIWALPMFIYGLVTNHSQGTLTLAFALEMFFEIAAITAVLALAIWFAITLPLKRRTGEE